MSLQVNNSQSPNAPTPGNGLEPETARNPNERKYVLEDFSQQAINRGQVEINYLLTVFNDRVGDALKEFKTAVEQLANDGTVDFEALQRAIDAVSKANSAVAGPFPPGCGTGRVTAPPPPPPEEPPPV
jgi:hypothetical protein